MIGTNILFNPIQFLEVFNAGHDIGVHTWTHPYMTTLSNIDILGQVCNLVSPVLACADLHKSAGMDHATDP